MAQAIARNPGEVEFHQAVREVAESVTVVIEKRPELARAGHHCLTGSRDGCGKLDIERKNLP